MSHDGPVSPKRAVHPASEENDSVRTTGVETLVSPCAPVSTDTNVQQVSFPSGGEPADELATDGYRLPTPGDVIGGCYRITGELGRGAMGVVFAAVDENLRRPVALKLIRSELLRPGFVRRFMREAQAMARVNDPHVVSIHAFGEYQEAPYFVMELVEGQTLEHWLSQNAAFAKRHIVAHETAPSSDGHAIKTPASGGASLRVRLRLLHEICRGVAAIHAVGAVHRDLKPSNVLLDKNLRCRVADFGLSMLYENVMSTEVAGTLAYMAPELSNSLGGRRPVGPVSDVYSLGCIAYELLTGTHPFARQGRAHSDAHQVPPRAPPPPSSLRGDLPRALDTVLQAALSQDPHTRTPTVEEFRRAIFMAQVVAPDRILIAEGEGGFRETLRAALQSKYPAANIEAVDDGYAALDAADRQPASVAIVDLRMPGMNGVELTKALRTRAETASMPIIVLSDTGGASEWQQLSSLGADRFLVRPVSLDDLISVIEHAIAERTTALPETLVPAEPEALERRAFGGTSDADSG